LTGRVGRREARANKEHTISLRDRTSELKGGQKEHQLQMQTIFNAVQRKKSKVRGFGEFLQSQKVPVLRAREGNRDHKKKNKKGKEEERFEGF